MKFDSSVREKFEDEAPPTAHLSYRILEQAFRTYLILNIELFITEHPVSLDERGLSLTIEQRDSR